MQLHWSGSTRYNNWFDKHRTIPRRMMYQAHQAGLIGAVDWIAVGPKDKRKEVEQQEDILEQLLNHRPRRGELFRIAAGGSQPIPWQMTLGLFPFQKSVGQVQGYNIFNLWFDSQPFEGPNNSDKLVQAFRAIHTPDNTEFAFIHPYQRWSELSDTLLGHYGSPVTIGPMFSGVYWVNFLGIGHLAFFNLAALRDLQSYQVAWTEDKGLLVRVTRDVAKATSPIVEKEMFRVTERFRAALR